MENVSDNNIVIIGGKIVSVPEFSHEIFDEKFYKFNIETKRLSNSSDILPIIVSERLVELDTLKLDKIVEIEGQFRSYNQQTEGKSKLVLSIFAKDIIEKESSDDILTKNDATFVGYICKPPIYRKTPLGREIADILLAVNRTYKKSDYIPCILWGRNAKFCEKLPVGTMVKLSGRIQSRKYEKKYEDGTVKEMVAYEISVAKFSLNKTETVVEKEEQNV